MINAPALSRGLNLDRSGLTAPTDGDVIPLVRIPPQYPQRAASRGVNGWVQLEFTITETGGVEDIIVIAAEPTGYFERGRRACFGPLEVQAENYRWPSRPALQQPGGHHLRDGAIGETSQSTAD